ncbi:hypothetical protein GGI11_002170 [Coemansia sp. RSA 2049]|nr:hypothetical protein GGI11_002170 [Coemansia sp. RSA 2049]
MPINGIHGSHSSGGGPIWFTRMPSLVGQDTHSTNFLLCQMAHNGLSRWTVSTSSNSPDSTDKPECSSCFCLPDTQRVGCVRTTCSADQVGTKNTQSPLPSPLQPAALTIEELRRRDSSQSQHDMRVVKVFGSFGDCVKAHGGKTSFKDDCNSCACSSEGTVVCTLMLCPTPTSTSYTHPSAQPTHPLPADYDSYEQCVHANGGSADFKRECNDCRCLKDGKIACTKKLCPHMLP